MKLKYNLGDRVLYTMPSETEGGNRVERIGTVTLIHMEISKLGTSVSYELNENTQVLDSFIVGRIQILKDTTTTETGKKRGRPQKQTDWIKAEAIHTNGSSPRINECMDLNGKLATPPPADLL